MDLLKLADRAWPVLGKLSDGHVLLYRATGGRLGHHVPGLPPMLVLEHVGARTGARRSTPLLYLADGDDLVIVASKGGHPGHPGWFHNLRANPDTTVQVGPERRRVRARVAEPSERARLWPRLVEIYGPYQSYQARTEREIPVVILEPVVSPSASGRRSLS